MFFFRLVSLLPLWLLYIKADVLAFLMSLVGYRKKVVTVNLRKSFPNESEKNIKIIRKKFYKNLADVLVETLKLLTMRPETLRKRVQLVHPEVLREMLEKYGSVVALATHRCNWEWLLAAHAAYGIPSDAVYKQLSHPFFDRLMKKIRSRFGAHLIEMKEVLRMCVKRKGISKVIALVADQSSAGEAAYHWTTFMGQDTVFFNGPEKIARTFRYPAVYVSMQRVKRGCYEVRYAVIAEPPYDEKVSGFIIEQYKELCEKDIRENPSDWLWSHKRWKHRKPSDAV